MQRMEYLASLRTKKFPRDKQVRGVKLRQLLYLVIVVFKAKLVLHRPSDNCNSAKKKKPWGKYNHVHLLFPECKNTKPNKMCKWQQVTDLTDYMKLHFSTMEKVSTSTLSGMVKYLSKPPRTDLGPWLDPEIEHEFEVKSATMLLKLRNPLQSCSMSSSKWTRMTARLARAAKTYSI